MDNWTAANCNTGWEIGRKGNRTTALVWGKRAPCSSPNKIPISGPQGWPCLPLVPGPGTPPTSDFPKNPSHNYSPPSEPTSRTKRSWAAREDARKTDYHQIKLSDSYYPSNDINSGACDLKIFFETEAEKRAAEEVIQEQVLHHQGRGISAFAIIADDSVFLIKEVCDKSDQTIPTIYTVGSSAANQKKPPRRGLARNQTRPGVEISSDIEKLSMMLEIFCSILCNIIVVFIMKIERFYQNKVIQILNLLIKFTSDSVIEIYTRSSLENKSLVLPTEREVLQNKNQLKYYRTKISRIPSTVDLQGLGPPTSSHSTLPLHSTSLILPYVCNVIHTVYFIILYKIMKKTVINMNVYS